MAYHKSLRDHLEKMEEKGKLIRIKREINKDTELLPLVRLQFRGLPEEERKGFLFDNIVDSKGKKYDIPLVVGVIAASREIYAMGMNCDPDKITETWFKAQANPIEPVIVADGPVQEVVHIGDGLLEHGGLEEFPFQISTPGYDSGPFITAPYVVSKDPETGVANLGMYRIHIKSPTRTGIWFNSVTQHGAMHLAKAKKMGKPLEVAIVMGGPPSLGFVSVTRLPYEVNEFAYVGGIAGEPLEMVKCKSIDVEVPAHAEIVIEGLLSTDELEPEAPFGEALGYMGKRDMMPYITVTCITHRKDPIYQAFLSQYPPSESSMIKGIGNSSALYRHLKAVCDQPWVLDVLCHESTGSVGLNAIKIAKTEQANVWKTLDEASKWAGAHRPNSKLFITLDEDIDISDADAINWAICTRCLPHRDSRIDTSLTTSIFDFSVVSPEVNESRDVERECSRLLLNATMKWPYPPVSLPKKEYMERALQIWEEEKLPALKLKKPWWGIDLGYWPAEWDEHAEMAAQGDYKAVGDILATRRKKVK